MILFSLFFIISKVWYFELKPLKNIKVIISCEKVWIIFSVKCSSLFEIKLNILFSFVFTEVVIIISFCESSKFPLFLWFEK
jgi:hypothetical protein